LRITSSGWLRFCWNAVRKSRTSFSGSLFFKTEHAIENERAIMAAQAKYFFITVPVKIRTGKVSYFQIIIQCLFCISIVASTRN
jgi:hypothetical protein